MKPGNRETIAAVSILLAVAAALSLAAMGALILREWKRPRDA